MGYLIKLFIFVLMSDCILAFNLSPENSDLISDPQYPTESYFGYAVGLQKNPSRLVVGAPLSSSERHPTIRKPGAVYVCRHANFRNCQQMLLEHAGERSGVGADGLYRDNKNYSFIGGSLDVSDTASNIVVCGPLWKNQHYSNFYLTNGVCYYILDSNKVNSEGQKLLPLIEGQKQKYNDDYAFYYAYGQAGFSAHLTPSRTKELILGAPGVLLWAGTAVKYFYSETSQSYNSPTIPNPQHSFNLGINPSDLAGYSVSSGQFESDSRLYIMSAPRSAMYRGQVFVFNFPKANDSALHLWTLVRGTQMGEYFGASLAAVDFDGDGLDDLLVGAPLNCGEEGKEGDSGAVYVYRNSELRKKNNLQPASLLLTGSSVRGARFGSSIGALTDIDLDGYKDVAVGAPYEGNGVVYIYAGGVNGLINVPSQRIPASSVSLSLSGFGFSISRALDIDDNNYPDIAVGAYVSGHAAVIKSRPVVDLTARLNSNTKRIDVNSTRQFSLELCITYQGKFVPQNLAVIAVLKVDGLHRRSLQSESSRVWNLEAGNEKCDTHLVVLKPVEEWSQSAIFFDFSASLAVSLRTDAHDSLVCLSCPILSPHSHLTDSHVIQVMDACGKETCVSHWHIQAHFATNPFELGSMNWAGLHVEISNRGDSAHILRVLVVLPTGVHLRATPSACSPLPDSNQTHWSCLAGLRIDSQKQANFDIHLDMMNASVGALQVNLTAQSYNLDSPTTAHAILNIIKISRLQVSSSSLSPVITIPPLKTRQNELVSCTHAYEVFGTGYTPVTGILYTFQVPHQIRFANQWYTLLSNITVLGDDTLNQNCTVESDVNEMDNNYLSQEMNSGQFGLLRKENPRQLACGDDDVGCLRIVCADGPLLPRHSLYLLVQMLLNLSVSEMMVNETHQIMVNTSVSVSVDGEANAGDAALVRTATSLIMAAPAARQNPLLPLFIALAVAIALALLIIITVALWKCGFFKRIHGPLPTTPEEIQLGAAAADTADVSADGVSSGEE